MELNIKTSEKLGNQRDGCTRDLRTRLDLLRLFAGAGGMREFKVVKPT
jgi:hypothetical protein